MKNLFITLKTKDVLELHTIQIESFGGPQGKFLDSYDRVEAILNQVYPKFGYEKYKTIFEKVSAITYFLVKDHCFMDGNKRIALTVCDILLQLNGYILMLSEEDAYKLIYDIASSNITSCNSEYKINELANLLKDNCQIK